MTKISFGSDRLSFIQWECPRGWPIGAVVLSQGGTRCLDFRFVEVLACDKREIQSSEKMFSDKHCHDFSFVKVQNFDEAEIMDRTIEIT